jgi:HSP20 family molecular chaperone IbpA
MSLLNTLVPSISRAPAVAGENSPTEFPNAVKPLYDIAETTDAFGVTVQMPGVAKEGLEITVDQAQVRILGRRAWKQPDGWTALHRETVDAPFELLLAHENAIDTEKIVAELRDGVLRISLPKHEAIKPRKITVA